MPSNTREQRIRERTGGEEHRRYTIYLLKRHANEPGYWSWNAVTVPSADAPTPRMNSARFGDLLICPDCKNNYAQKLREGVMIQTTPGRYAGFWIRFVAWLIDSIILMVVGSIVQFAVLGSLVTIHGCNRARAPDAAFGAIAGMLGIVYLVNLTIACTYESFFVGSKLSATPGKLALGLKVLRPNGRESLSGARRGAILQRF